MRCQLQYQSVKRKITGCQYFTLSHYQAQQAKVHASNAFKIRFEDFKHDLGQPYPELDTTATFAYLIRRQQNKPLRVIQSHPQNSKLWSLNYVLQSLSQQPKCGAWVAHWQSRRLSSEGLWVRLPLQPPSKDLGQVLHLQLPVARASA